MKKQTYRANYIYMKFINRHKQLMNEAILLFACEADTLTIIVVRQAGAILESQPSLLVILSYC